ncbi:MAG: 50S ribosomal protein L17 [Bacteroidia bacterium]
MRHGKKLNHLSRKAPHRKAMMANMASSLILHKRINTTLAKAKALRVFVEPLLTKSKEDTTHSRRTVFSYLKDKNAVSELFRDISVKIADRPGGYTRIIKLGNRLGDNAEMALIELVDYNENLKKDSKPKTEKKTRRAGAKKKVDAPKAEAAATSDEVVEAPTTSEEVAEAPKAEAKASPEPDTEASPDENAETDSEEGKTAE